MKFVRTLLLVLAVLICAWFVVGVRQARNTDLATNALAPHTSVTATQGARITSWLDAAAWLNPDRQVDVLRGKLAFKEHDSQRAVAILLGVTRDEPKNLLAWVGLLQPALRVNQDLFSLAVRELKILDPRL